MFTAPCFIRKNNSKLRKRLEFLGYNVSEKLNTMGDYIICNGLTAMCIIKPIGWREKSELDKFINCGNNHELFFAVAALRDDSDYMQWMHGINIMTGDDDWILCYDNILLNEPFIPCLRKATVEELIQHFNETKEVSK